MNNKLIYEETSPENGHKKEQIVTLQGQQNCSIKIILWCLFIVKAKRLITLTSRVAGIPFCHGCPLSPCDPLSPGDPFSP